jgi:hypothetical protein
MNHYMVKSNHEGTKLSMDFFFLSQEVNYNFRKTQGQIKNF